MSLESALRSVGVAAISALGARHSLTAESTRVPRAAPARKENTCAV